MECQLQRYVEHSHANHCHRQQRRRAGLAVVKKGAAIARTHNVVTTATDPRNENPCMIQVSAGVA